MPLGTDWTTVHLNCWGSIRYPLNEYKTSTKILTDCRHYPRGIKMASLEDISSIFPWANTPILVSMWYYPLFPFTCSLFSGCLMNIGAIITGVHRVSAFKTPHHIVILSSVVRWHRVNNPQYMRHIERIPCPESVAFVATWNYFYHIHTQVRAKEKVPDQLKFWSPIQKLSQSLIFLATSWICSLQFLLFYLVAQAVSSEKNKENLLWLSFWDISAPC